MNMEKAFEAVTSGRLSLQKAAEEHGVPKSTLHDKVLGKASSGARKHLTDEEASSLVDYLVGCASIRYAKSRRNVLAIAQQIANVQDPKIQVTKGWWDSFRSIKLQHRKPLIEILVVLIVLICFVYFWLFSYRTHLLSSYGIPLLRTTHCQMIYTCAS